MDGHWVLRTVPHIDLLRGFAPDKDWKGLSRKTEVSSFNGVQQLVHMCTVQYMHCARFTHQRMFIKP